MSPQPATQTSPRAVRKYPWLPRETWIAGGALLVGLIPLPLLIYLAGQLTLGDYESGGLAAFLKDFYLGLLTASPTTWCAVLGPYVFLSFIRLVMLISRRYLRPA